MKKSILKCITLLLSLCLLFTIPVVADTYDKDEILELSLDDAIEYALKNSNTLKMTEISINNQVKAVEEAEENKDSIKITAEFGFTSLNTTLQSLLIKKGYVEKQQEFELNELNLSKEKAIEGIKLDVEASYFRLKAAEEKVRIEKDNLDNAQKELDNVKQKFDLGSSTKIDVLNNEILLESASISYQNAMDDYYYEKMVFNNTIGLDLDKEVILTDKLQATTINDIDLTQKIDFALTNGYDYLKTKHDHDLAVLYLDIVKSMYTSRTDVYRAASDNLKISQYNMDDTMNDIKLKVTKSHMDLVKAQRSLNSMKNQVQLAKQMYEISQLSYETGLNTALDVSKARISLRQAELGYNQTLLAYNLAIKSFEMSYK